MSEKRMLRPHLLFVLAALGVALTSILGCSTTHPYSVAAGAYEVRFQTATATVSPLASTETVVEGGHEFVVESALITYEIQTFENRQLLATVRGKKGEAFHIDERAYRAMLDAFVAALSARAADEGSVSKCDDPRPEDDAPAGLAGWFVTCSRTHKPVTQTVAFRVMASGRVLFIQAGSWTNDWGQEKTRAFFRSVRRSHPESPAGPDVTVASPSVVQRIIASMVR